MTQHILITGCSGGGKSTLLEALRLQGYPVVPEPGLRVVKEESAKGGTAVPWNDMERFLHRTRQTALEDLNRTKTLQGPVFYDRGLLDAAVGLWHYCNLPLLDTLGQIFPYADRMIVAPPWRKCFAETAERRHSFEDAVAEYERITRQILELGYETVELPFASVEARVACVECTFDLTHA